MMSEERDKLHSVESAARFLGGISPGTIRMWRGPCPPPPTPPNDQPWFRFDPEAWAKMQRGEMTGPGEDFDFVIRARDHYHCRTFTNGDYICDHLHSHSLASLHRDKQLALQAVREQRCIVVQTQKDMGLGPEVKIVGSWNVQAKGAARRAQPGCLRRERVN